MRSALLCIALVLLATPAAAVEDARTSRQTAQVLLLHTFGLSRPLRAVFDPAFTAALRADGRPVDVHTESLDEDRQWPKDQPERLLGYLEGKYGDRRMDVIVAVGDQALAVARQLRPGLGDPPVVASPFSGAEKLDPEAGVTGIDATVSFRETAELALAIEPDTRRFIVVDGAPRNQGEVERTLRAQLRGLPIETEYLRNLPLAEVVSRVAAAPDDTAVLFVRQRLRDDARDIDSLESVARVARASSVPVYSINETHIGHGVVGGTVWRFDDLATRMARQVLRLAHGETVAQVPPEAIVRTARVDWRELQRWNLPSTRLPPGTEVQFRPRSVFEEYGAYLIAGALLFALQMALIVRLLLERRLRRQAERDAERLRRDLAHWNRMSALSYLAASFSDDLSQPLTGMLSNAQAARRLLDRGVATPQEMSEILREIADDSTRAAAVTANVRELLARRAAARAPLDLNDVIRDATALAAAESVLRRVTIDLVPAPRPLTIEGDRTQLQQVLLNLLLNATEAATQSAPPHRVSVDASASDGTEAHVVVRDSGRGLADPTRLFKPFYARGDRELGMGLTIARAIVEAHGGRIWAAPSSEQGAELHFTIPRATA